MFCAKCGAENGDNNYRCAHCGVELLRAAQSHEACIVKSHLAWAIIVTCLCFLPFGIVAIVYAAHSQQSAALGNLEQAKKSAAQAMTWIKLSFIIGLIIGIALAVLFCVDEYQDSRRRHASDQYWEDQMKQIRGIQQEIEHRFRSNTPGSSIPSMSCPPADSPSQPPSGPVGWIAPAPQLALFSPGRACEERTWAEERRTGLRSISI
ncbi:MAG: CD225/dispanin family protein [Candidatus Brocadiia bacterium]